MCFFSRFAHQQNHKYQIFSGKPGGNFLSLLDLVRSSDSVVLFMEVPSDPKEIGIDQWGCNILSAIAAQGVSSNNCTILVHGLNQIPIKVSHSHQLICVLGNKTKIYELEKCSLHIFNLICL